MLDFSSTVVPRPDIYCAVISISGNHIPVKRQLNVSRVAGKVRACSARPASPSYECHQAISSSSFCALSLFFWLRGTKNELQTLAHLHFAILSEFEDQVTKGKSGMQAQGSTDIT